MSWRRGWGLPSLVLTCLLSASVGATEVLPAQGTLQAAFTPWDDIEELIAGAIDKARHQVLVQAYLLTNKRIVAALVAARRRDVDVRVLMDAGQMARVGTSAAERMTAANIPVWLETKYQNAHNKVIVIDAGDAGATVITGSFNFTWTAQHKNAENVLLARDNPALAARYAHNWERHRQEATRYQR